MQPDNSTPDRRAFCEQKLEELRETCRETGLKLTHQRMEILRELAATTDHPSAETVYKRVREKLPSVSLDTVYRTLATFAEHGLVDKLNVAQDQSRFDADVSPHHHLVCSRCKTIKDFSWEDFDSMDLPPDAKLWGHIDGKHVVVAGVCRRCLAMDAARDGTREVSRGAEKFDPKHMKN
jgi:Fur family transcriptional regulator, peroxide stress response regulator